MNILLASLLVMSLSVLAVAPASAKNWTVEERQSQLMKDINQGQKANELTPKEAKKLRGDLANLVRHKTNLKQEAKDGKLTKDDDLKLESDLNGVSAKIKELELAKRVK